MTFHHWICMDLKYYIISLIDPRYTLKWYQELTVVERLEYITFCNNCIFGMLGRNDRTLTLSNHPGEVKKRIAGCISSRWNRDDSG